VLDRQWALRARENAAQLNEHLREFVDPFDGITVVEIGEERSMAGDGGFEGVVARWHC
jgi:hypothetical protein